MQTPERHFLTIPGYLHYTYFAATKDGEYVKIGDTTKPAGRFRFLESWMRDHLPGRELEYLCVVPEEVITELEAHRQFKHLKVIPEGCDRRPMEWFRYTQEIADYVSSIHHLAIPRYWWHGAPRAKVAWFGDPRWQLPEHKYRIGELYTPEYAASAPAFHAQFDG